MASWLDEVQTSMDAVVDDFTPVDPVFLLEIRVKARLDVFNDRFPTVRCKGEKQTRSVHLCHTCRRC
jgi:hypothetical protein